MLSLFLVLNHLLDQLMILFSDSLCSCIMKVLEDKGEILLTAEEHAAFVQRLRLSRKPDDMERLQFYFRGHADAVAYLKKSKRSDFNGSEQFGPFYMTDTYRQAAVTC